LQRGSRLTAELLRWLPRRGSWRLGLGTANGIEQTTFSLRLIPVLRRERIDVLHVQDALVAAMMQAARRFRLIRTRTILGHGTNEPLSFLQRINYLQQLAPWHLEQVRLAGASKDSWTAIPNFVDIEWFRPCESQHERIALRRKLAIPDDAFVVLTAAAIKKEHKRVDHLIREVARLRDRQPELPIHLVVAGARDPESDEVVRLGRERLGDQFVPLVSLPRPHMPELYRAADVFVLGSLREMMPIALLEACASGLPCVTHRHPLFAWMTGGGGIPVDMEADGALAVAIQSLLKDASLRCQLGEKARRNCVQHFQRDVVIDRILRYYQLVLSDGGRQRGATSACLAPCP
jgi:glycosyltransferase involved in cell wall biosynthesis